MTKGRVNLGLVSIVFALVGASALGACSDDDTNTGDTAGTNSGGKSGGGGSAGKGGASAGSGGASAGKGGASAGNGGDAGATEGGAAGSGEGGAAGTGEGGEAGFAEGGEGPDLPCAPALVKPTGVPTDIAVKDTATLVAVYAAVGVQTYTCKATTVDTTTTYAWATPSVPTANLYNQACALAGTHYAGPHWKANDGSILAGTVLRTVAQVGAIPWVLLPTSVDGGVAGVLTPVKAIQRLATVGGTAPANSSCTAANVNATAAIPYTANYYFYSGTDIIPAAVP